MGEPLSIEDRGDVRCLRLDTGRLNVLDLDSIGALQDALHSAESASDLSALIVLGREDGFCAGLDTKLVSTGGDRMTRTLIAMGELLVGLYRSRLRVVAACRGHAVAAGAMLLLVCDLRIGTPGRYRLGFSEMSIGLPLPGLPIALARDRLARPAWQRATLLGELHSPEEAVAVGFLDRLVEPEALEATAFSAAGSLAALDDSAYLETLARVRGPTIERLESLIDALRTRSP